MLLSVAEQVNNCCANKWTTKIPLEKSRDPRTITIAILFSLWGSEDPSTLPVYICRNHHPRNVLGIRAHPPCNWEEGFCDALHRSTFCAVLDPLETGPWRFPLLSEHPTPTYIGNAVLYRTAFFVQPTYTFVQLHFTKSISYIMFISKCWLGRCFRPVMNARCKRDIQHPKLNRLSKFHFLVKFSLKCKNWLKRDVV